MRSRAVPNCGAVRPLFLAPVTSAVSWVARIESLSASSSFERASRWTRHAGSGTGLPHFASAAAVSSLAFGYAACMSCICILCTAAVSPRALACAMACAACMYRCWKAGSLIAFAWASLVCLLQRVERLAAARIDLGRAALVRLFILVVRVGDLGALVG